MNLEPIRELVRQLQKCESLNPGAETAFDWDDSRDIGDAADDAKRALPALSQLLEAVTNLTAYEAELRSKPEVPFPGCAEWQRNPDLMTQHFVWLAYKNCADKLQRLLHPEDTK